MVADTEVIPALRYPAQWHADVKHGADWVLPISFNPRFNDPVRNETASVPRSSLRPFASLFRSKEALYWTEVQHHQQAAAPDCVNYSSNAGHRETNVDASNNG